MSLPHTTVYSNTDQPYQQWEPAYVILGVWEGNTFIPTWIPYRLWQPAQKEAERLLAEMRQSKSASYTTRTCRWHQEMCEAVACYLRAAGVQVKITYPLIHEDHCRQFTLTKR